MNLATHHPVYARAYGPTATWSGSELSLARKKRMCVDECLHEIEIQGKASQPIILA